MKNILFIGISILFLYLNTKIVLSDIKYKKIPNRYLKYVLILLPIWYFFLIYFGIYETIRVIPFLLQILGALVVSFSIFHFGLWGAGDAKYLLVLSLFIPYIGIVPFIGNIALITLLFLLGYFIWFLIGPNLWNTQKRKMIYKYMWDIQKEKIITENQHKSYKEIIKGILKILNIFFIIFISLRLIRIHIIDYISITYGISFIDIFTYQYGVYLLLLLLGCVVIISIGVKFLFNYIKGITGKKYNLLFLLLINISGFIFFTYEYIQDSDFFIKNIMLIFTLYLAIYLLFKALLLAYKLVFILQEESLIHIKNLKEGMIVDKNFLRKSFEGQREVFSLSEISTLDIHVDAKSKKMLQKKYKQINNYINSHNPQGNISPFESIKVKKTFAFGSFIFIGFMASIILDYYDFSVIRFLVSLFQGT